MVRAKNVICECNEEIQGGLRNPHSFVPLAMKN